MRGEAGTGSCNLCVDMQGIEDAVDGLKIDGRFSIGMALDMTRIMLRTDLDLVSGKAVCAYRTDWKETGIGLLLAN